MVFTAVAALGALLLLGEGEASGLGAGFGRDRDVQRGVDVPVDPEPTTRRLEAGDTGETLLLEASDHLVRVPHGAMPLLEATLGVRLVDVLGTTGSCTGDGRDLGGLVFQAQDGEVVTAVIFTTAHLVLRLLNRLVVGAMAFLMITAFDHQLATCTRDVDVEGLTLQQLELLLLGVLQIELLGVEVPLVHDVPAVVTGGALDIAVPLRLTLALGADHESLGSRTAEAGVVHDDQTTGGADLVVIVAGAVLADGATLGQHVVVDERGLIVEGKFLFHGVVLLGRVVVGELDRLALLEHVLVLSAAADLDERHPVSGVVPSGERTLTVGGGVGRVAAHFELDALGALCSIVGDDLAVVHGVLLVVGVDGGVGVLVHFFYPP